MLLAWLRSAADRANHGGASPEAARSVSGGRTRLGRGLGRNSKLPPSSSSSSEFSAVIGSVDTRRLATPVEAPSRVAAFVGPAFDPPSRRIWMGLPGVLLLTLPDLVSCPSVSLCLVSLCVSCEALSRATRGPPSFATTALTSAARAALACSL